MKRSGAANAVQILSGLSLQHDIVAFSNIFEDAKVGVPVARDDAVSVFPRQCRPFKVAGSAPKFAGAIAFDDIELGIESRNSIIGDGIAALYRENRKGAGRARAFREYRGLDFRTRARPGLACARVEVFASAHDKANNSPRRQQERDRFLTGGA